MEPGGDGLPAGAVPPLRAALHGHRRPLRGARCLAACKLVVCVCACWVLLGVLRAALCGHRRPL